MRILHLSTHDVTGGAARAAFRLHDGLRRIGHDSRMLVFGRASGQPAVTRFEPSPTPWRRLARGLRRRRIADDFDAYRETRPAGYEQFTDDRTEYGSEVPRQLPAHDILNLHWTAGFVDYGALFSALPPETPVVWTLHDMNVFTGGCHYDAHCGKFAGSCGACPQLGSDQQGDLSREIWRRKAEVFAVRSPERLHVVADSHWLAGEARRSSLLTRFPVSVIHYGLDTAVFRPRGREEARAVLGIPSDARVLLFVADSVENERKGFALLGNAIRELRQISGLHLVSIGRGEPRLDSGVPHLHIAHVGNDAFLSILYSAADVFVLPSLQEAFGQTVLESLACGTPAVGFAVGGVPDIIRHGVTGLLAPSVGAESLGAAIVQLLSEPDRRAEMGANGRRIALEEHGLEVQARRYETLYDSLLTHAGSRGTT